MTTECPTCNDEGIVPDDWGCGGDCCPPFVLCPDCENAKYGVKEEA